MQDGWAIELRDLSKSYGSTEALHGITLEVAPGQVHGYLGPNGAGKTTTIKILAGLVRPSGGEAWVAGRSVLREPLEVKARIGYLPESGAVFERLSTREYLGLMGDLYGLEPARTEERLHHWARWFGLEARLADRLGNLSRGSRQKVCWCAALLHDPEVLILDEPLSNLDVETVSRAKELLRELAGRGRTIFYSSHMIDVVEKVCDRIAVLHGGRLLAAGSLDEVRALGGESSLERALLRLWQPAGNA